MEEAESDGSFVPAFYKPAALLPIARHRQSLLYLVETTPVTIVVAATGSGKTTQIPQFLEQEGWCSEGKMIAVTQVGKFELVDTFMICSKHYSQEELRRRALQPELPRK